MARYNYTHITDFRGWFPNADHEDLPNGASVQCSNLKPYNGRLVKVNALDLDALRALSDDLDETQLDSIVAFAEFASNNIEIKETVYDSLFIAIGVHPSTGEVTVYALDKETYVSDTWVDAETIEKDKSSPAVMLFQLPSSVYMYNQINDILMSHNSFRVVPGNVATENSNDVSFLWVGWIDRSYFDEQVTPDASFYIYNGQISTQEDNISLSFNRRYMDDDALIYNLNAEVKTVDSGTPVVDIVLSNDYNIREGDDYSNGTKIMIDGVGEYEISDYDASERKISIAQDLSSILEVGQSVVVVVPEGFGIRPIEDRVIYHYKFSCVYDFRQESLLSDRTYSCGANSHEGIITDVTIDSNSLNRRITAVNIYRSESPDGPFSKIMNVDLTREVSEVTRGTASNYAELMTKVYAEGLDTFDFSNGTQYYLYLYDNDVPDIEYSDLLHKTGYNPPGDDPAFEIDIGNSLSGEDNNYLDIEGIVNNTHYTGKTNGYKYAWALYESGSTEYAAYGNTAYFGYNCVFVPVDVTANLDPGGSINIDTRIYQNIYTRVLNYELIEDANGSDTITAINIEHAFVRLTYSDDYAFEYWGVYPGLAKTTGVPVTGSCIGTHSIIINKANEDYGLSTTSGHYVGEVILIDEEDSPAGSGFFTVSSYTYTEATDEATIETSSTFSVLTVGDPANFWFIEPYNLAAISISKAGQPLKATFNGSEYVYTYIEYGLADGAPHPLEGEISVDVNAKFGVQHINRTFLANIILDPTDRAETHKDWIAYSEPAQHDVFPVSNIITIGDHDVSPITGIDVLGDSVVVLKEHGIYSIYTHGSNPSEWAVRQAMHNIGAISDKGYIVVHNSLYVCYYDGIYKITPNNLAESDRTPTRMLKISDPIQDDLDSFDKMDQITPYYSPKEGVIHFHLYDTDGDVNHDYVWDLYTEEWRFQVAADNPETFRIATIDLDGNLIGNANDTDGSFFSYGDNAASIIWESKKIVLSHFRHEIIRNIGVNYKSSGDVVNEVDTRPTMYIYDADDDSVLFSKVLPKNTSTSRYYFGCRTRAKRFYIKITASDIPDFELHSITIEHTGG